MTIRGGFGAACREFLENRAKNSVMRHPALAQLVTSHTPSTGAQYADYWALYAYVRRYKPREILELGPGITTLVLAQAVMENGSGRITAMEDIPFYYEATKQTIPSHLASHIDLRLSPTRDYRYGPFRGLAYTEIPDRPYDFVYVDGPNYDAQTQFDADIIDIVKRSQRPVTALIDSRTGSCFMYHLIFGSKFKFNYIKRLGIIEHVTKTDMRGYDAIVAAAMRQRQFKRWISFIR